MDSGDRKLDSPERQRSRRTSMRHSLTLRAERMDEFSDPDDSALASMTDDGGRHGPLHDPSPAVVALEQEFRDESLDQRGQVRGRITNDSGPPTSSPTFIPISPVRSLPQAESRTDRESTYGTDTDVAATTSPLELTTRSPELPQAPLRPPSPTKPTGSAADPLALRHDGATSPKPSSQHVGMDAAQSIGVPGSIQPPGPSHVYEQYTRNLPFGPPLGLSSDSLSRGYPYPGPQDPSPYHIYPQDVHNGPQYGRVVTQQGEVPVVDYYTPYGHHEPLPPYTERDNTGLGGGSSSSVSTNPTPAVNVTPSISQPAPTSAVVSAPALAFPPESTPALGPSLVSEELRDRTIPTAQPTQETLPSPQTPSTTQASSTTPQALATVQTEQTGQIGPAVEAARGEALTGAGGLGLATRNPEFDSLDDLRAPRPRASTRSFNTTQSNDQINDEKAAIAEKETPFKRWMRKQWCFGVVPNWALVLSLCLLVIVGIVAGTVAGVLLSRHGKPQPRDGHPKPTPGSTLPSNVVPITTPTDIAPLPTGTWSIPMMLNKASSNCFKDPTQSKTWDCHFVPSGMHLAIENSAPDGYTFTINCNHSLTMANNVYSYGEQPAIMVNPSALVLVNDSLEANRGPAWFQSFPYNKTVILPQDSLNISTTDGVAKLRRRWDNKDYNKRKNYGAQPGDKPWICNWPQTTFELYIYAQQNSSWSINTQSLSPPSATISGPAPTDSTTMTVVVTKTETDHIPLPTTANIPSSLSSSPDRYSHYTTKQFDQKPPDGDMYYHPYKHRQFEGNRNDKDKDKESSSSSETPSSTSPGPMGTGPRGDGFAPPPPGYPRVIKLEERRYLDAPIPQCTQFEIPTNGQEAQPIRDEKGNMVVVTIYPPEATETGSPKRFRPRLGKRFTDWDLELDEEDDGLIWRNEVIRRDEGDGGMSSASSGVAPFGSQCNCEWFVT